MHQDAIHIDDSRGLFVIATGPAAETGPNAASVFVQSVSSQAARLGDILHLVSGAGATWRKIHDVYTEVFEEASVAVRERAENIGPTRTSGTVVVARAGHIALAHVGVTRGYFIRKNQLVRLTRDHEPNAAAPSVPAEESTLVAIPNMDRQTLSRQSVGQPSPLRVDGIVFRVQEDDRVVLVSSAVGECIRGEQIFRLHMSARGPVQFVTTVLDLASDQSAEPDISCISLGFASQADAQPIAPVEPEPEPVPRVIAADPPPPAEPEPEPPAKEPSTPKRRITTNLNALYEQLRKVHLFAHLSDPQLERFVQCMTSQSIGEEEIIWTPDDDSDRLCLVTMGTLDEVFGDRVVARYGPWDVVGAGALFAGEPRRRTVRALTSTRVKSIARADLLSILESDDAMAAQVYRNLSLHLLHRLDAPPVQIDD